MSAVASAPARARPLVGLGLNKRHRSRELVDTPEVRGMINKVRHLLRIDEEAR